MATTPVTFETSELDTKTSAHYRNRVEIVCQHCDQPTPVVIDPYRVADVVGPLHPIAFHMLKKLMRAGSKGHSEVDLIKELMACTHRWREMLQETGEWPKQEGGGGQQ